MRTPKEDPVEKAARERERRISTLERSAATQEEAEGLTTDLRSVYGLRSISLFGMPGLSPVVRPTPPKINKPGSQYQTIQRPRLNAEEGRDKRS